MNRILAPALVSLLVLSGVQTARAQDTTSVPQPVPTVVPATDTVPPPAVVPTVDSVAPPAAPAPAAEPAGPYRTDVAAPTAAPSTTPCVRQVRRIPPPRSPRSFRRQWAFAALGSIAGWFAADRVVGPKDQPMVILSSSTLGAIVGSHLQAGSEGHPSLGRSILGGMLGALPAGAVLAMNRADQYDEAEFATRGIVPVVGGAIQAVVTAGVTSSSLQPTRIQIIECPHAAPAASAPVP